ncbi:MAG: carbamoyltransferase N-terminal domain-containing protein [Polyangiales bacterium]
MRVLGVSYGYHDASACVVVDGRVVAAAAEERFTRQKHDANFPTFAVARCLADAGLALDDVDEVVFHEDPHAKFSRVLAASLAPFPASRLEFVNAMKAWLGKKLWALGSISARLGVDLDRVSYLGHHFSHAVQAFMGSGFDDAAILVVDAVGDWACSALYAGRWVDGRPEVRRVLEVAYPNSLGLAYSAFTAWLGFSPNDSECSTMALAGFGRPTYADAVRAVIAEADDTVYAVDQRYFHFASFYQGAFTARFVEVFGPPRTPGTPLPFACFGAGGEVSADHQRYADVAASVQLVMEERVLALCARLRAEVPSDRLCYAGGVALNCVLNARIVAEGPFREVFIPPDPGDGGTAVGAALFVDAVRAPSPVKTAPYGPYLGPEVDEAPDLAVVDHVRPDHVLPYLKPGVPATPGVRWRRARHDDLGSLCEEVARRVEAGEIVGWFQGRAELGPRALGHRSIVARPDDLGVATRLSRAVKERAAFRPYALSLRREDADAILDLDPARRPDLRWMQYAVRVRPEVRARVACGLHIDGSTRAQVCGADDDPTFHALLSAYGRRAGLAALLNTSFNASGYPIVATTLEALAMFARTDMDALVINRSLVWKDRG